VFAIQVLEQKFVELYAISKVLKDPKRASPTAHYTKAGAFEIRLLSEHQNYNLENEHITMATLIKFAQKIVC
jgi:hypothetical protein